MTEKRFIARNRLLDVALKPNHRNRVDNKPANLDHRPDDGTIVHHHLAIFGKDQREVAARHYVGAVSANRCEVARNKRLRRKARLILGHSGTFGDCRGRSLLALVCRRTIGVLHRVGGTANRMNDDLRQNLIDQLYLEFLIYECHGCLLSLHRIQRQLDTMDSSNHALIGRFIFIDIQNAVCFAGNVSKMLWPHARKAIKGIADPRGQRLRSLLGIQSDAILEQRVFRDELEHLDERIDSWTQRPNLNAALFNIHPDGAIAGLDPEDTFHRFDPSSGRVHFQGHALDLVALAASIERVKEAAEKRKAEIQQERFPNRPRAR